MLTNIRQSPPAITLALSVVVALAAGYLFFWLWREWLLFALILSALLLMSGGLLLSNKNNAVQAIALSAAIGAFLGSVIGISGA